MTTAGVGTVEAASANAPLNITGLASGLNTNEIITALLAAERQPVTQLTNKQTTLEGQTAQLQSIQSSLTALSFAGQELGSPVIFHTTQAVSSSNPTQITVANSNGAAIGGYEVEVAQLASSAQRTFTFKSPVTAETLTIDGQEIHLAAGASIKTLAETINAESSATVYAAALNSETLVLSTRTTGASGPGFIQVEDPGGTLVEQAGLAKEGRNAKYTVDGVAGSSSSNSVTGAIAGVTLSLKALTTSTGPVTIDVQAPAPNVSAIVSEVESFVKLYNSTIGAIEKQLGTKPPSNPQNKEELQSGTLFGDSELMGTLSSLRQQMYEPLEGLPQEMSSLADIGVSTGAPAGGKTSQSSLEGQLQLNVTGLEKALETNPSGVQQMLSKWSTGFQATVNAEALPGGNLEARINGDGELATEITRRINFMNESIALHQKTLQQEYEAMEAAVAHSHEVGSWLSSQLAALESASASASASPSSSGL